MVGAVLRSTTSIGYRSGRRNAVLDAGSHWSPIPKHQRWPASSKATANPDLRPWTRRSPRVVERDSLASWRVTLQSWVMPTLWLAGPVEKVPAFADPAARTFRRRWPSRVPEALGRPRVGSSLPVRRRHTGRNQARSSTTDVVRGATATSSGDGCRPVLSRLVSESAPTALSCHHIPDGEDRADWIRRC